MKAEKLKAPFPWFGGKSKVAAMVWRHLGGVDNYVEPFYGSGAVLLLRPGVPKVETVNDLDCYVANFWRATSRDPESVAAYADGPVNEADLHSRHRWLVLSEDAAAFRQRMRTDPDHFDAKVAGWWCWGLCCWIGGAWCAVPGETGGEVGANQSRRPVISAPGSGGGQGVHGSAAWQQIPSLRGSPGAAGMGVHSNDSLRQSRPFISGGEGQCGMGMDAHATLATCDARRAWLLDWFGRLRDRLRMVRVCCGDWLRVVKSYSVTTGIGTTGVFLDPPYDRRVGRDKGLYATDSEGVADRVRAWCLERGGDPLMRIILAGYAGEGHEALESAGWRVVSWKASGGYGNQSGKGQANARRERLWLSPHCQRGGLLFD